MFSTIKKGNIEEVQKLIDEIEPEKLANCLLEEDQDRHSLLFRLMVLDPYIVIKKLKDYPDELHAALEDNGKGDGNMIHYSALEFHPEITKAILETYDNPNDLLRAFSIKNNGFRFYDTGKNI